MLPNMMARGFNISHVRSLFTPASAYFQPIFGVGDFSADFFLFCGLKTYLYTIICMGFLLLFITFDLGNKT